MRFGIAECVHDPEGLRVVRLVEKPAPGTSGSNLAILGRYVVTPAVMTGLREQASAVDGELQLADGFATALGAGEAIMATAFTGTHFDCGTPEAYARSIAQAAVWTQPADALARAGAEH